MADATTTKTTRDPPDTLSLQAHRRIVGLVGIMLPLLVYLWAGVRPTAGLPRWRLLWSVSAYYYTGAVEPSWWTAKTGLLHYVAAVVLFVSFILFAVWLFRKSDTPRRRDRPPDKRRRDDICLACGLAMIACVVWAGVDSYVDRPIFVPESIAIVAFALSWLVKGEAHEPVIRAVRRLMSGSGS